MRLLKWRPLVRNSLRGFATIQLANGLTIHDVAVHVSHGQPWAALPSKPMITDGRHKIGEDGKAVYTPLLEWRDKEQCDRFSAAVIVLLLEEHPHALEGDQ